MKHIKKFNEELKDDTYLSAARKLSIIKHYTRSDKLVKHVDKIRNDRFHKEWLESIEKYSPFGLFKIKINNIIQDYYLIITYNSDMFLDNSFSRDASIFMNFSIGIIPPDIDTHKKLKGVKFDSDSKYDYIHNIFGLDIVIKLNEFDSDVIKFNLYNIENAESAEIVDRRSAYKFKKLFRSVFTDKEYPTSGFWTTKYKSVYNHIDLSLAESGVSSDFGLSMDDLVLGIDKTPINSLYSN